MDNKITWTNSYVSKSKLKHFDYNPRDITDQHKKLLEQSLEDYGQVKPLLVNKDFVVIGGNQRLKVLKDKVFVRMPDRLLDEKEMRDLCITHNMQIGDWDNNALEDMGFDDLALVDDFGFEEEFVGSLGFDFDDLDFDDMDVSIVIKKLIVKFQDGEDVELLVNNAKALLQKDKFEDVLLELAQRYNDRD